MTAEEILSRLREAITDDERRTCLRLDGADLCRARARYAAERELLADYSEAVTAVQRARAKAAGAHAVREGELPHVADERQRLAAAQAHARASVLRALAELVRRLAVAYGITITDGQCGCAGECVASVGILVVPDSLAGGGGPRRAG